MSEPVDFTKKWDFSDVILQFDDETKVYANRMTLCQWSPVFKVMLMTNNFKERDQNMIKLPEKKRKNFIKLMEVLHPPSKSITG